MLYLKDKPTILFRDKGEKYRPVSLYLGNKKIAGYKYLDLTGESLSVLDTYNDSANIKINGKSTRVVTVQGKNLLDKSELLHEVGSISTITGLNVTGITWKLRRKGYLKLSPSTTYHVKCFNGYIMGIVYAYDVNNSYLGTSALTSSGDGFRFTTPSNCDRIRYILQNATDTTIQLSELEQAQPMLELGNIYTSYSPFVPNSPSPDYPSPINSTNNFDLLSSGRNLFDGILELGFWSITTGLKTVNDSNTRCANYVKVKPNTTYTISGWTGGTATWIVLYDQYKNYIGSAFGNTFVTTAQTGHITFYRVNSADLSAKIMLNIGGIAFLHEKHSGSAVNFPYILRSLPDGTKDYIEVDNVAKTAKLYRNVGEVVLNGSGDYFIYVNGTNDNFTTVNRFISNSKTGMQNSICSHFPRISFGWDNPTSDRFSDHFSNTAKYFSINNATIGVLSTDDNITRINKWKTWLSNHPVQFQHELATPTVTDLDYNEIKTFYPYTQVYTTATIQPTLEGNFRIIGN